MKLNTPSPTQTRIIARRLARKVATLRKTKLKIIKKTPKNTNTQDLEIQDHREKSES